MEKLIKNIQFIIYAASIVAAFLIYILLLKQIPTEDIFNIRLTDLYALISLFLLYFAVVIRPLYSLFPSLSFKELFLKAQPALGLSALFFGLLHTYNSFFNLLGGFEGLGFLAGNYITAICLSAVALLILLIVAVATLTIIKKHIGVKGWKVLIGLVYFAGVLIVIHALMLGSHFIQLSRTIPQIFFFALIILLILEALRIDKYFTKKFNLTNQFNYASIIIVALITGLYFTYLSPHQDSSNNSFGIHSQHILLAQQAQINPITQDRYTVSMAPSLESISPNKDVTLKFTVFNSATGQQITNFDTVYSKLIHMVVVNNSLNYFHHIHPELKDGQFIITTQFPAEDLYHIYLNFQPSGAIEQQIAMTLQVGSGKSAESAASPDQNLVKTFGPYKVTLAKQGDFIAKDMSAGLEPVTFGFNSAQTGQEIKTLQPYLGAFGHLTMINEKTFDYVHVHPQVQVTSDSDTAGPAVSFLPLGLYGPIKPGIYRVFGEFNPDGNLITVDFTIQIY